jgi:rubredoxin
MGSWTPPRGAVEITPASKPASPSLIFSVHCQACGWTYAPVTGALKSDAEQHKRWHRCPEGTATAYPPCPTCGTLGKVCHRGKGDAPAWHPAREQAYAEAVRS